MNRAKGTGTVIQKKDKFYARWRIEGSELYGPARETRDEAESDRINNKPKSPETYIANRRMPTLAEFARMCMNEEDPTFGWYGKSLQTSSFNTNVIHLETHLVPSKLGALKLNAVEPIDVENWVREIQAKKWYSKNGKMTEVRTSASPAYKRRCHGFLRKIFNLAIKHKIVSFNPAVGVELPHIPERRNTSLTDDQLRSLYECVCRTGSLLTFAAETGLRRSELIEVKWSDISDAGLVVVNHKNHDQEDLIPLSEIARSVAERQTRLGAWVFCTENGKQLTTRNLNRDVRLLFDKLGFPKATRLHDLRGKFTTDLIVAGVDIKTTQTLARHKDASTTLKYYARTSDAAKIAALDSLKKKRGLGDGGVNQGSDKATL